MPCHPPPTIHHRRLKRTEALMSGPLRSAQLVHYRGRFRLRGWHVCHLLRWRRRWWPRWWLRRYFRAGRRWWAAFKRLPSYIARQRRRLLAEQRPAAP